MQNSAPLYSMIKVTAWIPGSPRRRFAAAPPWDDVGFLASGNAHDADGIADHVGVALLAFRSGGHLYCPTTDAAGRADVIGSA